MLIKKQAGMSLVEMIFALALFTIIAIALLTHFTTVFTETTTSKDRIFSFKKCNAILAELQTLIDNGQVDAAIDLDSLDDGAGFNPVLSTTADTVKKPDHPLSGNILRDGSWVWSRRITVRPFQGLNNRNVRYVTVRVFRRAKNDSQQEMAVISSVINSSASSFPSTQVYDLYLLAMENVPGWWVYMDTIKPFIDATTSDLEARNPGLKFRTHWITKLAYGRNPRYMPYTNNTIDSTSSVPYAYYYPGTMPAGSGSTSYYVPEDFQSLININGTVTNSRTNPPINPNRTGLFLPYTLADNFNQAMRYYDEKELFERRVAAGDEDPGEPTWRILLEQMATNPEDYHNAILINLHGELLPMPPLRNYSDPAKDIANYYGVRAVTHPEELRATRVAGDIPASDEVKLRVHTYLSDPNLTRTIADYVTVDIVCNAIDNKNNLVPLDYNFSGNVSLSYQSQPVVSSATPSATIYYLSPTSKLNPYGVGITRMVFRNMPVKHTQAASGTAGIPKGTKLVSPTPIVEPTDGSLALIDPTTTTTVTVNTTDNRLYGQEYIPCPMATGGAFRNLSSTLDAPKNTARWTVTLRKTSYTLPTAGKDEDLCFKVITRIGNANSTSFNKTEADLENKSVTYAWWTTSPDRVPYTERYQFIGDPRHCPYADLMHGGDSFPDGYNAYFDDFTNSSFDARSRWLASGTGQFNTDTTNGFPYLHSRWQDRLEIDVSRFSQLFRTAITKSEVVYSSISGWSYYYMGIGGEIGYDRSNGYADSIPVAGQPWGTTTTINVDSISSGGTLDYRNTKILRNGGATAANRWRSLYWLGELYPDTVFDDKSGWTSNPATTWQNSGNLPTLTWSLPQRYTFYRDRRQDINFDLPGGTTFDPCLRRTQQEGCTSIFLCGSSATSTFHHLANSSQGQLVDAGPELSTNYGFPLPQEADISRPFKIDCGAAGDLPNEWYFPNIFPHFGADMVNTYYNHPTGYTGSGLVRLTTPLSIADPARSAFIVVNGLDKTVVSGSAFIAKYSVVALIHSFLASGNLTTGSRIAQLPRVQIRNPVDITEILKPTSINIVYGIDWQRWDSKPYTNTTLSAQTEDETGLVYTLAYSADGGTTWKYVQNDSPAQVGLIPSDPSLVIADLAPGVETYNWQVPAMAFPEGTYLLRIECFRNNESQHFATHMSRFFIDR